MNENTTLFIDGNPICKCCLQHGSHFVLTQEGQAKILNASWFAWYLSILKSLNTLRPRQNGDIFEYIFFNENVWIPIKISLMFVPKGPINNIPALVQIMDWRWPGSKPLSGPMMVYFTDAYITRPQWVILLKPEDLWWYQNCKFCTKILCFISGGPTKSEWPLIEATAWSLGFRQQTTSHELNSLWPSDAIWRQGSRSTLVQVMACCLTAPSHYLNQCWLVITKVQWCSSGSNFAWDIRGISH